MDSKSHLIAGPAARFRCLGASLLVFLCWLAQTDSLLAQGGPPIFNTPPASQTVGVGSTLTLSVSVSSSTAVSYQWFKEGSSLGNGGQISGATSDHLVIVNVRTSDAGSYTVLAANSSGSSFSQSAAITVVASAPPPANDNFGTRTPLFGGSIVANGENVTATKEPGEPNLIGNIGGRSVWWTWTAPVHGTVSISTIGSSFDTLLGVYTGTNVSNLTPVASNDDTGTSSNSMVNFPVTGGTRYQIVVDGFNGVSGNIRLNLNLTSGRVVAWGDNTLGQTTIPASLNGVTAIAVGRDHNLALRNDGTVVVWGKVYIGSDYVADVDLLPVASGCCDRCLS